MRLERWPGHALPPEQFVDAAWHARNKQLITCGDAEKLKQCLSAAETRGEITAREVAEQILNQEVGTTQHDPRREIVAACNRILSKPRKDADQTEAKA